MYRTPGIVIGRINVGEADRIVTIITPEYGKLRASAKGVRKIKSRLAGHLELFSEVDLMLATGKNIDVVTSARMLRSSDSLMQTPVRLDASYMAAAALSLLTPEGEAHTELYDLARDFYQGLNDGGDVPLAELSFKLRLLDALGYRPELGYCMVCRSAESTASYYLSPERGGLLCADCGLGVGQQLSVNSIKLWRMALVLPTDHLQRIAGAGDIARSSLELVDEFYLYHFGRRFTGGLLGV